jgi:hypothetical protein
VPQFVYSRIVELCRRQIRARPGPDDPGGWRCRAANAPPLLDDDGVCCLCGREIRPSGTLGRAWRKAAYDRQLRWAPGEGLGPTLGLQGVAGESARTRPSSCCATRSRSRWAYEVRKRQVRGAVEHYYSATVRISLNQEPP